MPWQHSRKDNDFPISVPSQFGLDTFLYGMAVCCLTAVPVLCRDGCSKLGSLQECFKWFLMESVEVVRYCEKWWYFLKKFFSLKVGEDVHSLSTDCLSCLCSSSIQGQCGALLQSDGVATVPSVSPGLQPSLVFSTTLINRGTIFPHKTKESQSWYHRNDVSSTCLNDFTAQPGTFKRCYQVPRQQFQVWSLLVLKITFLS